MEKLTLFGERTACCSNVCAECCRSWKCDSAWNGRSWKRSALKSRALRNGALLRERRFRVAEDLPYHLLAAEILRGLCRRTACGDPACGRTAWPYEGIRNAGGVYFRKSNRFTRAICPAACRVAVRAFSASERRLSAAARSVPPTLSSSVAS